MSNRPWTDEEIAFAKERWQAGMSASEVSAAIKTKFKFSRSRNAVIGRLHRSGVVNNERSRAKMDRPMVVKAPPVPKLTRGQYTRVNPETLDKARGLPVAEKQAAVRQLGGSLAYVENGAGVESLNPRPFQERRLGQCAWPLGARAVTSCCNPVAGGEGFGSNYCPGHLKALLAPVQPKAPRAHDHVRQDAPKVSARSAWDSGRIAA